MVKSRSAWVILVAVLFALGAVGILRSRGALRATKVAAAPAATSPSTPATDGSAAPAAPAAMPATTPAAPAAQSADPSTAGLEVYLFKNPKPAPALNVTTLDGRHINLAALHGKVVLLNFWATWCGPCREEIPGLIRLQKEYPNQLQIVGMSVDEIPPAQVATIVHKLGINYPVAMASAAVQRRFGGMPAIPLTFVIGPDGRVQQKNRGANPYEVFNTEVRALLGMPTTVKVARIDELSPNGKVGTIDIPGIAAALKKLTPAQREEALARLNSQACTCGCDWSLATCRIQDPNCGYSLPEAEKVIAAIQAGH